MKQNLLKNTLIAGVAACTLGLLGACTSLTDDEPLVEEGRSTQTRAAVASQEVCTAENQGNCIIRYEEPDLNLNQTYAGYAMSTNSSYQVGDATVALSVPAGIDGLSVKDKIAQRAYAQQQADLALQPVKGGEVVCTGDACAEALFKTEIEKTIRTTVTENQSAQSKTDYVYVASNGQTMVAPTGNLVAADSEETTPVVADKNDSAEEKPMTETQKQQVQEQGDSADVNKPVSLKEKIAFGEEVHDWEAPAGETLRNLLMRWGEMSGWTVVWKLDRDYNLEAGVVFRGQFTEVAAAFIRSFARATPAPIGTFYKGNRVLVINVQENENAD